MYDPRADLAKVVVIPLFVFMGATLGLDYLADKYTAHQARMEEDPAYRVQVLQEKEQEKQEIRETLDKALNGMGKYFVR